MREYLDLLQDILDKGVNKNDRTGTGTLSIFGYQLRFDLSEGFPLLTTKKLHFRSIMEELLWFLRGESNIKSLRQAGVSIWNEWADSNGELGPVYGVQWRRWVGCNGKYIDQVEQLETDIDNNPDSRRMIVSAWNVADLPRMALAPCHIMFQIYIVNKCISLHMYQRSVDTFLGLPFNIASYALLTHMLAKAHGLTAKDLIMSLGDTHLYLDHLEQAKLQLTRTPKKLPSITITGDHSSILSINTSNIEIVNYNPHPSIKAAISI